MAVIQAENLSFNYGSQPILKNASFFVRRGEFISIIGLNGSGKSTLLKLILGELLPQKGEVRLFDTPSERFNDWHRLGYIPQAYSVLGGFPATAEEIVIANLFSKIKLMRFAKKEHREMTREALRTVGMEDCAAQLIGNLSGGQQQRVMIARAIVHRPEVLILDEPTAGVDSAMSAALYELLKRLSEERQMTVLMVTHDTERVLEYSSRIICVEDGSLMELDKQSLRHELSHKHKHPVDDE